MDPGSWTDLVKRAVLSAQEFCIDKGIPQIDPLHLFSTLIKDKNGICFQVLEKTQTDFNTLQVELEKALKKFPAQSPPPDSAPPNHAMMDVFRRAKTLQQEASASLCDAAFELRPEATSPESGGRSVRLAWFRLQMTPTWPWTSSSSL